MNSSGVRSMDAVEATHPKNFKTFRVFSYHVIKNLTLNLINIVKSYDAIIYTLLPYLMKFVKGSVE